VPHPALSRAANVGRGRLQRGAVPTPQHRAESRRNADVIDVADEAATYPQQPAATTMDATPPTLDAADTWPKLSAFITKSSFVYVLVMLACTFSNRVMKSTKRKKNNRQLAWRSQRKELGAALSTAALPRTVRVTVGTDYHRENSVWCQSESDSATQASRMAVRGRTWHRNQGGGVPASRERDGWLAK